MTPCPRCNNPLLIDPAHAGQVVACPYCGQPISVELPPAPQQLTRTAPRRRKSTGLDSFILWGSIATAVLLLCGLIYYLLDAQGTTPIAIKARLKAREAVLLVLKYPRDAELSVASDFSQPFVGECKVHGTVKIASRIGAKLTHDYYVTMAIGKNGELSVIGIEFDPPAN